MYYTTRHSFGAVGTTPPPSVAGYEWYPVFQKDSSGRDIPTHQASYCPSPAPYGCTVHQGFAWALIQSNPSEFTAKPSSAAQLRQFCDAAYASWLANNPLKAQCLTTSDKANFDQLCGAAAAGQPIDSAALWEQYVLDKCKARCVEAYNAWRAANPALAACVPEADGRMMFRKNCMAVIRGERSASGAQKRWDDYVQSQCGTKPSPGAPTPGAPTPPTMGEPISPPPSSFSEPPSDYTPPGGTVEMPSDGGRQPADDWEAPPLEDSVLRRVGPIVGIGLVLAVGFTLYRTRGKGGRKRRARR